MLNETTSRLGEGEGREEGITLNANSDNVTIRIKQFQLHMYSSLVE